MEYLVTMTSRVPSGTSEHDIADIRAREASHTRQLALQGRVRRLWRPPLQPGEWRTIGLFSAADSADLEHVLSSMPLRIWRTDDVTPLVRHPNDPGYQRTTPDPTRTEFFTTFVLSIPPATPAASIEAVTAQEAERAHELADQHHLIRLWTLPGQGRNLGHWQAPNSQVLQIILESLPMMDGLHVDTVQLSRHPSDPATQELDGTLAEVRGQQYEANAGPPTPTQPLSSAATRGR